MLQFSLEFDFLELDAARKEHVHELAISRSRTQFFDFSVSCQETVIDPGQHLMPREVLIGHRCIVNIDCHCSKLSANIDKAILTHF